ncbi:MAG: hypothetical protein KDD82_07390 [Planctomycetes bacterium]|nr:hypothetical protein [Planctomycetota bacterium]
MPDYRDLARIVQRLVTDPAGWRVDELCAELELPEGTYREYRRLLQEEFSPREGDPSLIQEVTEGGARTLRLVVPGSQPPPGDPTSDGAGSEAPSPRRCWP